MKLSNRRKLAKSRRPMKVVAYGVHRREPDFSRLTSTLLDSYLRQQAESATGRHHDSEEANDGAA